MPFVSCLGFVLVVGLGLGWQPGQLSAQDSPVKFGVVKSRLKNSLGDLADKRWSLFQACTCENGVQTQQGRVTHYYFCKTCKGTNRVLSKSAFDALMDLHATQARPKVEFRELKAAWDEATRGHRASESGVWKSIWANSQLKNLADQLNASTRPFGDKPILNSIGSLSSARWKVNDDGVLLTHVDLKYENNSLPDEARTLAWQENSKRKKWSWVIATDGDIADLSVKAHGPLASMLWFLRPFAARLENLRYDEASRAGIRVIRQELEAEEDRSSLYWYLVWHREFLSTLSLLVVHEERLRLAEDPEPEVAAMSYEALATRTGTRKHRDAEQSAAFGLRDGVLGFAGEQLACELARKQRLRLAAWAQARANLVYCEQILEFRPHHVARILPSIEALDIRVSKWSAVADLKARLKPVLLSAEAQAAKLDILRAEKLLAYESALKDEMSPEDKIAVRAEYIDILGQCALAFRDIDPDKTHRMIDAILALNPNAESAFRLRIAMYSEAGAWDDVVRVTQVYLASIEKAAAVDRGAVFSIDIRLNAAVAQLQSGAREVGAKFLEPVVESLLNTDDHRSKYHLARGLMAVYDKDQPMVDRCLRELDDLHTKSKRAGILVDYLQLKARGAVSPEERDDVMNRLRILRGTTLH